jgi:hypothetical protein
VVVGLGGVAIILGGQAAFVAGVLALWQFALGGRQLVLVQRRLGVALACAGIVVAGQATLAGFFRLELPGWWFALASTATVVSALGLGAAALALRRASALTPAAPIASRRLPAWFVLGTGLAAICVMTVGTAHAERSWAEGLIRGGFEAIAFVCGFVALGRFLGVRAPLRHEAASTLRQ